MRYAAMTALLVTGMGAAVARADLVTTQMDGVREEVVARIAAQDAPQNARERRLNRRLAAVLRQFDRNSNSPKSDAKRIRNVARKLVRALPDDAALQDELASGVDGFLGELRLGLTRANRSVGLMDESNPRRAAAVRSCARTDAVVAAAEDASTVVKRATALVRSADLLARTGRSVLKAARQNGPITVHHFDYDIAADEYVVEGARVPRADVLRDLSGSLCTKCHTASVAELKSSVHHKIAARSQRVLFPGGGAHGMLDRACGLPATTGLTNFNSDINLGECAKCHTGRYLPVMEGFFASMFGQMGVAAPQAEATKLLDAGLDCLICHSESYRAVPDDGVLAQVSPTAGDGARSPTAVGFARAARDNGDFDHDGRPDLVIDVDGDGTPDAPLMTDRDGDGIPETPWPTVAQDRGIDALRSIGATGEHSCLRCHEHARTGYKRGTLFLAGHDVHADTTAALFADAENRCTVCHTAQGHLFVRGHAVGGDLAAADHPAPPAGVAPDPDDPTDVSCQTCHDPSGLPGSIHTATHIQKIACETCHIPAGSGITYSLFGHGGQVSFARNADGKDTRLVVADMYMGGDRADLDADIAAYRTTPILSWFDGSASFLAQPLSARGMPNAKITPFKPMGNGMVFDARFFDGVTLKNDVGYDYNAYSMYRFFANGHNAEAFAALDMLDMSPEAVRSITTNAFFDPDPRVQAMGLMLIFPNLVYFDKARYGYEHYQTVLGSPYDQNRDGLIDAGADFNFDMLAASNSGLMQFMGFNGPLQFPADYQWYPFFDDVSQPISMKLPDGSLIKMFLQMQGAQIADPSRQAAFMAAIDNYPSFSQVTLGGHGVRPKEEAIGSCTSCHADGGLMAHKVPVGVRVPVDMGAMGTLEFPQYRWRYYNVRALVNLGLATTCEEVLAGTTDIDVDGDTRYVRDSATDFIVNWFAPNAPGGYRRATDATALSGTGLAANDLTWSGGAWMPVLEPVVQYLSNARVLGYGQDWVPISPAAK